MADWLELCLLLSEEVDVYACPVIAFRQVSKFCCFAFKPNVNPLCNELVVSFIQKDTLGEL